MSKVRRSLLALLPVLCLSAVAAAQDKQSSPTQGGRESELGIPRFALDHRGRSSFDALTREPCDRSAVLQLGRSASRAGYRREAANLHIRFSERCNSHAPSLRAAVNYLMTISDYEAAVDVATKLIALQPFHNNGYFLRGLAYFDSHRSERAIDDFITAIELFGDKANISSASYVRLSKSYERLGQFCDAIAPIEAWVAIDPERNDSSRAQAMIDALRAKGGCAAEARKTERFRRGRRNGIVKLAVAINGKRGWFVLDTGATFVSMKRSFAKKAGVKIDESSSVRLSTANGIAFGKRGRAQHIKLRSLAAENVPIIVQSDNKGAYGRKIDGLLGMSFLSHFDVEMGRRSVTIRSR
ncbi:MAG: aspartyl protease family protein [Hyphomicrobiaceae bacterium]